MKRILWYAGPPILWMAFIFFLSSQHKVAIGSTYTIDFVIKKSLHMIEYAALYFLLFRMFHGLQKKNKKKNIFLFSFIISFLFALSDELHQTFVPTREGRLRDIVIDTTGMVIMYIYIKKFGAPVLKRFL